MENLLLLTKDNMNIVNYITHCGSDLTVVNSARVSFGKSKKKLDDKDKKLINYLVKNKHMSPFEHCFMTIKIECPIYIRSQIMRHRTFCFSEISRRYTNENIKFYIPKYRKQHEKSKQCSSGNINKLFNKELQLLTKTHHKKSLKLYDKLIKDGVSRELARGILPQNLMTEFYMSGNLRNFHHFLELRLDSHAQEEVHIIAKQIYLVLLNKFPESIKALFINYKK